MAKKANSKTDNKELVQDILYDQFSMGIERFSKKQASIRLEHNVRELYRRLNIEIKEDEYLYYA